jgi:low affinity Fe/Cu permease
MNSKARKIAGHIALFVVILVIIGAVAIWLGLGPVVHS